MYKNQRKNDDTLWADMPLMTEVDQNCQAAK